jgi:hypothetical protein
MTVSMTTTLYCNFFMGDWPARSCTSRLEFDTAQPLLARSVASSKHGWVSAFDKDYCSKHAWYAKTEVGRDGTPIQ